MFLEKSFKLRKVRKFVKHFSFYIRSYVSSLDGDANWQMITSDCIQSILEMLL